VGYPGGKNGAGVYQTIINLMPPHRVYIEPFLGGGAILRLKRPAAVTVGLDLDPAVISQWRSPLAGPAAQQHKSAVIEAGEVDCLKACTGTYDDKGLPWFLFSRECGIDFLRRLSRTQPGPETLIYCDPPYVLSSRKQGREIYNFEMTDQQHAELIDILKSPGMKARVLLSGYWSTMYGRMLRRWNCAPFQTSTRGGTPATEYVWFNFPAPVELHDYRFLGADYRERERIKRKKTRLVKRLERMPLLERQALLSAIAETSGVAR